MHDVMGMLTNEDRIFINAGFVGNTVDEFTKQKMINYLRFQIQIASDPEIIGQLEETLEKVKEITDTQWDLVRALLPLDTWGDADTDDEAEML